MVKFLTRVQLVLETIVERLGQLGGWVLFVTVALVFINTFNRYVFEFSPMWLQELEWHLLAANVALGLAYAWVHRDHIAVDFFSQRYSARGRQWMEFLVAVVIAIPVTIFMIKISFPYVERAYTMGEGSPNPGGLPYRWIPRSFVIVAFALLLLEAIATAIRSGLALFAPQSQASPPEHSDANNSS